MPAAEHAKRTAAVTLWIKLRESHGSSKAARMTGYPDTALVQHARKIGVPIPKMTTAKSR